MEITVPHKQIDELLGHPLVIALLEHAMDGALVIDARDRRIVAMNARARQLLGYQRDEVIGCQCRKMMNSPACSQACPLTAALEGRQEETSLTLYYRGREGNRFLNADTRMLLVRDEEGDPIAGIELFSDLREVEDLKKQLRQRGSLHGIIGKAPVMQRLYELVEQVAPYPIPVLITGPSGVGKERFADALHHYSSRAEKALVKINCAALSTDLVESQLFGHKRGAFTGAVSDRRGFFEEAHQGTILLDEVGELPSHVQAKLLRVLQEGEIQRVGEDRVRHVDVRILAATNRDLEQDVASGQFRQDLFFRLSGLRLEVPELAERLEDIPLLADHFLTQFSKAFSCPKPQLDEAAANQLMARAWPGNVRELENVLRLATIKSLGKGVITPDMIDPASKLGTGLQTLNLKELERTAIERAMAQCEDNLARAADLLGIDRTTLWRKLKKT